MKSTLIIIAIIFSLLLIFSNFSYRTITADEYQLSTQETTSTTPTSNKIEKTSLITSIFISWWWYILYYGFGIMIGAFVYRDAKDNNNLALNIKPFWWGVITAFEPPLGLLAYWLIHYSKLKSENITNNT